MQTSANTKIFSDPLTAEQQEEAKRQIEARREYRRRRFQQKWRATVPEVYKNAHVRDAKCRTWLGEYRKGERRNLVLSGSNGTGKTTTMYALCNSLFRYGVECEFGTVSSLLRKVKDQFNTDKEGLFFDRMERVPVLFLDDAGKEIASDWACEQVFEVLDFRYSHRLPVVVSTNLSSGGLAKHYGATGSAIVSRLMGGAVSVEFKGRDMRMQGR